MKKHRRARFAICIDHGGCPVSLHVGGIHQVPATEKIARKIGLIRVIDNEGEDYLHDKDQFSRLTPPGVNLAH